MTHFQVLEILRERAREAGSQNKLARRIGVSPQYVTDVLQLKRTIGGSILRHLGLRKVVSFVPDDTLKPAAETQESKPCAI